MTRKDRIRRSVRLCCSFATNLAFYRAGQSEDGKHLLSPTGQNASFWRQANSNFLDICVLEWCKLLGDKRGEHYWTQVVSDAATFETGLLRHVGMEASAFNDCVMEIRGYRDKFVAHLDSSLVMNIPVLDRAKASVWFYHGYVVAHEAQAGDLTGLPDTSEKFSRGYEQCVDDARNVFARA